MNVKLKENIGFRVHNPDNTDAVISYFRVERSCHRNEQESEVFLSKLLKLINDDYTFYIHDRLDVPHIDWTVNHVQYFHLRPHNNVQSWDQY